MNTAPKPASGDIPKSVFRKVVKELIDDTREEGQPPLAISKDALEILQLDAESRLVDLFNIANAKAVKQKRQTMKVEDFKAACVESTSYTVDEAERARELQENGWLTSPEERPEEPSGSSSLNAAAAPLAPRPPPPPRRSALD